MITVCLQSFLAWSILRHYLFASCQVIRSDKATPTLIFGLGNCIDHRFAQLEIPGYYTRLCRCLIPGPHSFASFKNHRLRVVPVPCCPQRLSRPPSIKPNRSPLSLINYPMAESTELTYSDVSEHSSKRVSGFCRFTHFY